MLEVSEKEKAEMKERIEEFLDYSHISKIRWSHLDIKWYFDILVIDEKERELHKAVFDISDKEVDHRGYFKEILENYCLEINRIVWEMKRR